MIHRLAVSTFHNLRVFLRPPLFSSVPTFFLSVLARSFSLYRLSFDLLPGAGSSSLQAYLHSDIFELQETKLPVRLINTTYARILFQGHERSLLRVKGDFEDIYSELDNRVEGCTSWFKPRTWKPNGYGHELVAGMSYVRVLVPLKTCRVEEADAR
ncbi:hypothetical protein TNCV_1800251 [Trichonephila clavipes]|nr:hypothetical protein TNCV_1800251 [Trichonephila clavipes]